MILEEETYKKFGYYPSDLKPKSGKRILVKCDECGKTREVRKDSYYNLCLSCGHKGQISPMLGKHHTMNAKIKMSNTKKGMPLSLETRIKMSIARKGKRHPNWKGGNIERTCVICGTLFEVKRSKATKNLGLFCSSKCHGIATRGENSPAWKGGLSHGNYCSKWNEAFREYIRNKFTRKCFLCDKTEEENGQKLSVHHVNYQKSCGCAETEESKKADDKACQFVPLCMVCHGKTHTNRDYWRSVIMKKLRNNLNGWYI